MEIIIRMGICKVSLELPFAVEIKFRDRVGGGSWRFSLVALSQIPNIADSQSPIL
jgi:hypothetical protein